MQQYINKYNCNSNGNWGKYGGFNDDDDGDFNVDDEDYEDKSKKLFLDDPAVQSVDCANDFLIMEHKFDCEKRQAINTLYCNVLLGEFGLGTIFYTIVILSLAVVKKVTILYLHPYTCVY